MERGEGNNSSLLTNTLYQEIEAIKSVNDTRSKIRKNYEKRGYSGERERKRERERELKLISGGYMQENNNNDDTYFSKLLCFPAYNLLRVNGIDALKMLFSREKRRETAHVTFFH